MPSSVVASFDYDPVKSSLRVKFVSGLLYEYQQVPVEVFQKMKQAFSKGTFLNKHIKGNYSFKKIKTANN